MSKKIVFVESSCIGAGYSAEAAINLGYSPIFLTHRADSQGDTRIQMLKYDCIECDTRTVDEMSNAILNADLKDIRFITSFNDTSIINAAILARRLGTDGMGLIIERLKDKGEVYNFIPEFSPPSVLFSAQDIPVEKIERLFEHGPTVMVKARRASGGLGAFHLTSPTDMNNLRERTSSASIPDFLAPDLWLAQSFVEGELVSLEGYVCKSRIKFLGFSGRKKLGMTESAIMFPWDAKIAPEAIDQAKMAVTQLVARSGFNNAYFHIEFIVNKHRAVLIDANMGRIGGGALGEQIAMAFGVAPEMVYRHALALMVEGRDLGGDEIFKCSPKPTSSSFYGIPIEAELLSIRLPELKNCFHTQVLDAGQVVSPMGTDNYAWVGILSSESDRALKETPRIRIVTSKGEFGAIF